MAESIERMPRLFQSLRPDRDQLQLDAHLDVTGAITLPDGAEMVMPGDNVEMGVELITPIALEVGQRFAIREGGRTVGAGAITSLAG